MRPWEFKSHEQLVQAGYIWKGYGACRESGCRRAILFYRNPNGKLVPVDPETFELHFATCEKRVRAKREKEADEKFLRAMGVSP